MGMPRVAKCVTRYSQRKPLYLLLKAAKGVLRMLHDKMECFSHKSKYVAWVASNESYSQERPR